MEGARPHLVHCELPSERPPVVGVRAVRQVKIITSARRQDPARDSGAGTVRHWIDTLVAPGLRRARSRIQTRRSRRSHQRVMPGLFGGETAVTRLNVIDEIWIGTDPALFISQLVANCKGAMAVWERERFSAATVAGLPAHLEHGGRAGDYRPEEVPPSASGCAQSFSS